MPRENACQSHACTRLWLSKWSYRQSDITRPAFIISILSELKVPLTDIEVKVVHVGKQEAFVYQSQLLSEADQIQKENELVFQTFKLSYNPWLINKLMVKLAWRFWWTRRRKVESDEDLADILFSVLTIPMGTICNSFSLMGLV
ncbi:hypothetical protein FEM48_Zijuj02G0060900 [Ziziphus jujuba var. spinosa]|uniref:Uncharacterized protein n=1 Tax=Ziziphus jujuba var. spinosa TaxID=714518 RepID=A0A978VU23_ZIZJJ|nr:hypothetical protein FEM48_Zijuj02G0060900 [Ziziphus jujuba var. spinosa]